MDKDLTILLPLKGREAFTWRWMNYYNQTKLPFKVIVADGSKENGAEKLKNQSLYPYVNYEYVRYPYDKDISTFLAKVNDALSRVKTKYVLFACNDDFYFEKSILSAIKFLDEHHEYVASRGHMYDYHLQDEVYGKIISFSPMGNFPSITAETALERIRIFSEFSASIYWNDVCRTSVLREAFKALLQSTIVDFERADHFINLFLVAEGKINRGSGLHMLHQTHTGGLGHEIFSKDLFEAIMEKMWAEDISKIFKLIGNKISSKENIPPEYAVFRVMQYYLVYLFGKSTVKARVEKSMRSKTSQIVSFAYVLGKNNIFRKIIKKVYYGFKNWRQAMKSDAAIAASPYAIEIEKIKIFLLNK